MKPKNIYINVSCDWEGRNLESINLNKMSKFIEEFPDIPILHYMNPAYYTRKIKKPNSKIKKVIKKNDTIGLHIHCWKSLIKKCDVKVRLKPTWSYYGDCDGYAVPLTSYNKEELNKIIKNSLKILGDNGFSNIDCFRAGGWFANDNVFEALLNNNIKLDSSHVDLSLIEYYHPRVSGMLEKIWEDIEYDTQVYKKQINDDYIIEYPNNGCFCDYHDKDVMIKIVKDNIELWENSDKDIFISLGFHQESADDYLDRLIETIKEIKTNDYFKKYPIVFIGNPLSVIDYSSL